MSPPEATIRVNVDPTNPGQFFACCGLLELADRLWGGAEGWFEQGRFHIASGGGLDELVRAVAREPLRQLDIEDATASPVGLGPAFGDLRLDWWKDDQAGGKELKVWAGRMESYRIARAMQDAMRADGFLASDLFDVGMIAYDPLEPTKKVEPFYLDARRAPNAHSRDVGFSPNDLGMTTTAFPAVEFFCLVGLQRCLPAETGQRRVYRYHTWGTPLPPSLVPSAASGLLPVAGRLGYQFENWYRTGQKKHKAFRPAVPINP